MRRIALLVVAVAVFVCGCGSDDTLEASLDSAELADLEAKARTYFDYIYDVYPDMDARYAGDVAGVGIHHTWSAQSTSGPAQVESLTLLRLGEVIDDKYQPHPDRLITSEELYHTPASLSSFTP